MNKRPSAKPAKPESFSLELVASVAVQFIAAKLVPAANPLETTDAAHMAIALLHGCKKAILWDEHQQAQHAQFHELLKTAPNQIPYSKALLYITDKNRATDALPPFRAFLQQQLTIMPEQLLAEFKLLPTDAASASPETVLELMQDGRLFGRVQLARFRSDFEFFHTHTWLPSQRKASGKMGGKAKKKKL